MLTRFLHWLFKTNEPAAPKMIDGHWHYKDSVYPPEQGSDVEKYYERDKHEAWCERAW